VVIRIQIPESERRVCFLAVRCRIGFDRILLLQIEPYDVGISPEMEQQVANLLQSLEIQPVPQVKCYYSTPFKTLIFQTSVTNVHQ